MLAEKLVSWLWIALPLASCGESLPSAQAKDAPAEPAQAHAVEASAPEPLPWDFDPGLAPERRLSGYSWDGVGSVPWLSERPPERLVFGELGRTALTGLYLTFNHDLAAEAALQPPGWRLKAERLAPRAGRFGGGVQLGADSVLAWEIPPEVRAVRAWTLEFWLRPARLEACKLLEVSGQLAVAVGADGRLALRVAGTDATDERAPAALAFVHPTALRAGQWNHVALVLDLQDARGARAVINGEAHGIRLDPARVRGEARALVLGDLGGDASGLDSVLDELRFQARGASTAELAEHWRRERGPVERLRLACDASAGSVGDEELELWREPQTEARIDALDEWARGELVHAHASSAGLAWTPEHWSRIVAPERPVARTTHPLVSLGGQRVFTFGGETRDTHWGPTANTDDTWILDGAAGRWARVPTSVAPSPRCHMPAAYSPAHDLVLLVGGWWQGGWWSDEPATTYGDTWVFHVAEQRWEQRFPGGDALPRLSDNGLVYLPSARRFLVLSGNRTWSYDPEADRWDSAGRMRVVGADGQPAQRAPSYTCALDPLSEQVLVFGGLASDDPQGFVEQTGLYDVRTNTLTLLALPVQPPARVRAALAYDPVRARFVLFGGVRDQRSQRFDDLWTFDPRSRRWSEVARAAERPSARGGYFGLAYDEVADRFVLAAGRHANERWLDETWALTLDERRAGTARYLFDRAAFPDARTWFVECDEGDTSAGAAVHVRFRAGSDGLRFGAWSADVPRAGRYLEVELALAPGTAGSRPRVRAMGFRDS